MKQHNRFRLDNTEGYSEEELARLNAAFDRIVDVRSRQNSDEADESWLDHIADGVLSSFGTTHDPDDHGGTPHDC